MKFTPATAILTTAPPGWLSYRHPIPPGCRRITMYSRQLQTLSNMSAPRAAPPALTSATASPAPAQPVALEEKKEATKEVEAEPKSEPKPDPVADLIAKVEKQYEAGRANYQAGRLEEAKKNFDDAF